MDLGLRVVGLGFRASGCAVSAVGFLGRLPGRPSCPGTSGSPRCKSENGSLMFKFRV